MTTKEKREIYYNKLLEKRKANLLKSVKSVVVKKPVQKEINWESLNNYFKNKYGTTIYK